jgi:hypothetical protein
MPVPNTFGTATSAIPLSQLDANFATPITIGNTAVQLGNTVTTLNNMTLANVSITSGTITITNVAVTTANVSGTANVSTLVVVGNATVGGNATITGNITSSTLTSGRVPYSTTAGLLTDSANLLYAGADLTVYGVRVGRGAGAVATNTAVGASALAANTTGEANVAVGYQALKANIASSYNTAVGASALLVNDTGSFNSAYGLNSLVSNLSGANNTALGSYALQANTTATNNTAVGYQAGYTNSMGSFNTFVGRVAGYSSNFNGNALNTFVGNAAGYQVTEGTKNTILGSFEGLGGGLDIRTASNYIVLSDGDGNPRGYYDSAASVWNLGGGRTVVGTAFVGDNQASGNNVGFAFGGSGIVPCNGSGAPTDNVLNLGSATARYATIYAGTGTINTSDANAKQDIEYLSDAERRVAVRIKSLIKKYRFKDAVAEKGDAARIHVGVIAQEVQAAFIAEGLDSARYALFCSDTWYEVDGHSLDEEKRAYSADAPNAVEKTRLGIRYDELLAFVIAAM